MAAERRRFRIDCSCWHDGRTRSGGMDRRFQRASRFFHFAVGEMDDARNVGPPRQDLVSVIFRTIEPNRPSVESDRPPGLHHRDMDILAGSTRSRSPRRDLALPLRARPSLAVWVLPTRPYALLPIISACGSATSRSDMDENSTMTEGDYVVISRGEPHAILFGSPGPSLFGLLDYR